MRHSLLCPSLDTSLVFLQGTNITVISSLICGGIIVCQVTEMYNKPNNIQLRFKLNPYDQWQLLIIFFSLVFTAELLEVSFILKSRVNGCLSKRFTTVFSGSASSPLK